MVLRNRVSRANASVVTSVDALVVSKNSPGRRSVVP